MTYTGEASFGPGVGGGGGGGFGSASGGGGGENGNQIFFIFNDGSNGWGVFSQVLQSTFKSSGEPDYL